MGVQIPATWQGVATQAQISPAQQLATGVPGAGIPQAAGVVAYPIQQFQVSPQVGVNSCLYSYNNNGDIDKSRCCSCYCISARYISSC